MDLLVSPAASIMWRAFSVLTLAWLAFFFGRTLRRGQTPLIERFARAGTPVLTPELARYTRALTAVWSIYFFGAALAVCFSVHASTVTGLFAGCGSAVLFVGEHALRARIFPAEKFPGLLQQVRDTWQVWRQQ